MRIEILNPFSALQRRTFGPMIGALRAGTICAACFFSLHTGAQSAADNTTLRLQILSGKTGRPITSQHLSLARKDGKPLDGLTKPGETTDGEGYVSIPNLDTSVPAISILVDQHVPCSKTQRHDFELAKVRAKGVVSENSCRPRITMFPQPGTLIFYVRDETLLEKMRH